MYGNRCPHWSSLRTIQGWHSLEKVLCVLRQWRHNLENNRFVWYDRNFKPWAHWNINLLWRTRKTLHYFSSSIFSRKGPQSSFQRPRWVQKLRSKVVQVILISNSQIIHSGNTKESNVDWVFRKQMKNCSFLLSWFLLLKSFRLKSNIKHETQCFITRVRQKYSVARRIFNSLLVVLSGDETLRLVLEILRQKQVFQWLCV